MINENEFNWTLYVTYYTIDPKTRRRKSTVKTVRFILDSKIACVNHLSDFDKDTREIVGHTILDHLKGLALYLKDV